MESEDKKPIFTKKLVLGILAVILLILIIFLLLRNCSGNGGDDYNVSYVQVSPTATGLGIGDTVLLTATLSPSDAKNKTVYWSSSNDAVATVDSNTGLVTGVGEGTATITARSEDGGHTGDCIVTVSKKIPDLEDIQLTSSKYSIRVGRSVLVQVTPAPTTAELPALVYRVDNESIATVSTSGVLKGVAVGTTKLTVTTIDGTHSAEATVVVTKNNPTVEEPIPTAVRLTSLSFATTSPTQICVGTPIQLVYVGSPDNATDKSVTWTIDNPIDVDKMLNKYASINQNGIITGIAAGTVKVTITSKENNKLYSIATIKVLSKSNSACSSGTSSGGSTSGGSSDTSKTTASNGITCTTTSEKGNGKWYTKYIVTWSYTPTPFSNDAYSHRSYCVNNSCTEFSGSQYLSTPEGKTEYRYGYRYVDPNGKTITESSKCGTVVYVDRTVPTCNITSVKDNGKIMVTLTGTDATSGVAKLEINGAYNSYGEDKYEASKTIEMDSSIAKRYSGIVYDHAGNKQTCSALINPDGTPKADPYATDVILSASSDAILGSEGSKKFSARIKMSDGTNKYPNANDFTASGGDISGSNGNYVFKAIAGNTKGNITLSDTGYNDKKITKEVSFSILDETSMPTVSMSVNATTVNGTSYYGGDNATVSASVSGSYKVKICASTSVVCDPSSGSSSVKLTSTGTYRVYYQVTTENGGKFEKAFLGTVYFDNTKPTCTITKTNDKFKLTASDDGSGITIVDIGGEKTTVNKKSYSRNDLNVTAYAGKVVTVTDYFGKTATCKFDNAGTPTLDYLTLVGRKEMVVGFESSLLIVAIDSTGKSNPEMKTPGFNLVSNSNPSCVSASIGNSSIVLNTKSTKLSDGNSCTADIKISSKYDTSKTAVATITVKSQLRTAKFNCNGGTGDINPKTCTATTAAGCQITLPTGCTRTGYVFNGWNPSSTAIDGSTGNITLDKTYTQIFYATWLPKESQSYTATFNCNGGTTSGKSVQSCNPVNGSTCTVVPPTCSRESFAFNGWSTSSTASFGGTGSTITMSSETNAKTYYATWAPAQTETATITINRSAAADTWNRLTLAGNIVVNAPAGSSVQFSCGTATCGSTDTVGTGGILQRGFSVPGNGTYTITVTVTLNGNQIGRKSQTVTYSKIDNKAPACVITYAGNTLYADVIEDGSGIAAYDGWIRIDEFAYKRSVNSAGTYNFTVKDVAGNTGTCSATLREQYQSKTNTCTEYSGYTSRELGEEEDTGSCTDTSSQKGTALTYYTCTRTTRCKYNSAAYYFGPASAVTCTVSASGYNYSNETSAINACKAKCSSYTSSSHPSSKWTDPCDATCYTYTDKKAYTAGSCAKYSTGAWKNVNSCSNYESVVGTVECRKVLVVN